MNLPSFSSLLTWLMPVAQYEWKTPENSETPQTPAQDGEAPCAPEVATPQPEPQLVFTGYRWVPRSVFVSSPNPHWEKEVEERVELDGHKGVERGREARRGDGSAEPPPDHAAAAGSKGGSE